MPKTEEVKLTPRDKETIEKLVDMTGDIVKLAQCKKDPAVDIPVRALSNVSFNERKKIIEMGRRTSQQQLFNLSQGQNYLHEY